MSKGFYVKFWAWVYRKTGYYHKAIDSIILKFILDSAGSIQSSYELRKDEISLKNEISIKIGTWQAIHGFARPFTLNEKKRLKRFKKLRKKN